MKNLAPTKSPDAATPLKLVHSPALQTLPETPLRQLQKTKRLSPYKRFFQLHDAVQDPLNWDTAWFGNYE